jgi:bloom syndrome protein
MEQETSVKKKRVSSEWNRKFEWDEMVKMANEMIFGNADFREN